ncbi:hypothetical protein H0H87_003334 [Tephrocybe sp. NHM501043]|nr:hypothetical protein H0H87_003334 [Tephrocybe sp. NHM501043]
MSMLFTGSLLILAFSLQLPSVQAAAIYDYVVVGGGASGLALAARLSEDSSKSVAILEAGGSGHNEWVLVSLLVVDCPKQFTAQT